MSWFVMAVGVLALYRTIAWLVRLAKRRTWSVAASPLRRRPRRHRRLGDARHRRMGVKSARELVPVLANGPQSSVAYMSNGVILGVGEVLLQRTTSHFSVWATRSTWLSRSRVRGLGRRAESSTGEVSVSGWQDHGEVTWLVTSARLYGRARKGEIFSICWACLDSLEVDLEGDRVTFGSNGWRAQVIGPGIAPIAIAAVHACHGTAALLAHRGLARLRIRPLTRG